MSARLHAAPSPKAIHYAVLKGKMLKRNPTRIELKDVDEEFTNVERAQGGGTDNDKHVVEQAQWAMSFL